MAYIDQQNHKTNSSDFAQALDHLKSARNLLGNEFMVRFQEDNREDLPTLRLDAPIMSLVEGVNALSNAIDKLENFEELSEQYIIRVLDNKGMVAQERRYARGLKQALRWIKEMQEEYPGMSVESSLEGFEDIEED